MFIGIDIGTTSVKSVLVEEDGRVVATATAPLALTRPHPGWSEQDPEAWWAAVSETLDSLHAAQGRPDGRCRRNRTVGPDAWRNAAR